MDKAADWAARLSSTDGTRTCPTPAAAFAGAIVLLLCSFGALTSCSYISLAVVVGMITLGGWWIWRSPMVVSRHTTRLGYILPGQWVVVSDDRWLPKLAPVAARFDDYSLNPGPVISVGLGDGKTFNGLATDLVPTVELRTFKRYDQRHVDIGSTLASEKFFSVMAQAFDARQDDGRPDWSMADGDSTLNDLVQLARKLRLLEVHVRRSQATRFRCTEAGLVWVLQECRKRDVELIENAKRPEGNHSVNVNIGRDNNGVIQVATGRTVERISANLERVDGAEAGASDIATALRELTNGTATDETLSDEEKVEALEYLEQLSASSQEGGAAERPGNVKTVIRALGAVLSTSASLSTLWDVWAPSLMTFFSAR